MKTPPRRLGRGLGAFLDFSPSGEDGAAFVAGALAAHGTSILETSTSDAPPPSPSPEPRRVAVAAPPLNAAPVPATPAAPPPAPDAEEAGFVDDILDFGSSDDDGTVFVEAAAPPRAVSPVPATPTAPPAPPPLALDAGVFVDDVVLDVGFPEVDLD